MVIKLTFERESNLSSNCDVIYVCAQAERRAEKSLSNKLFSLSRFSFWELAIEARCYSVKIDNVSNVNTVSVTGISFSPVGNPQRTILSTRTIINGNVSSSRFW